MTNKKLCVYTCITGDYDNLHEVISPEKNVDYYCFTTNRKLKSETWKIIQIDNNGLDNQRLSRKIKMLGHPIISKNYDISIWTDASIIWKKPITEFIKKYLKNSSFAAFRHNSRNSVHEEAIACLRLHKDAKESIIETLNFLQSENFPDNLGLYEMTVFVKRHNDPKVIETMNLWFNMLKSHSKRDQLSFPYAIWKTGLKVSPISLNVWDNQWFCPVPHNSNNVIDDCHIYYGNPDVNFDFNKYYIYKFSQSKKTYQISTVIPVDTNEIEINPAHVTGIVHQNFKISLSTTHILFHDSIPYTTGMMFCTAHGIIRIHGDFKKGQKLSFSIDMRPPNTSDLQQIISELWSSKNSLFAQYQKVQEENQSLSNSLSITNQQLHNITNSKTYKSIRKIRGFFPPY